MSRNFETTLGDFFGAQALSDKQADLVWAGDSLSTVSRELQGKVPGPFWLSARSAIDQALQSLLEVSLIDILGGGWNKYRALIEYRDRKKHPSEEVALFPLHEHTITSTHKPQIEIYVNDRRIGSIDFEIQLVLELETAILKIQDGKIWEIQTGSCRGTGILMYGPAVLYERKTSKVQLPKLMSFSKGLAI